MDLRTPCHTRCIATIYYVLIVLQFFVFMIWSNIAIYVGIVTLGRTFSLMRYNENIIAIAIMFHLFSIQFQSYLTPLLYD